MNTGNRFNGFYLIILRHILDAERRGMAFHVERDRRTNAESRMNYFLRI